MKRNVRQIVFGLILVTLVQGLSITANALDLSAESAALLCVNNGEFLYQSNAHERRSMASTTKIMTALLVLEQCTPQKQVRAPKEAVMVEGTSMGLLVGDTVTYRDLAAGMLLESGNDAANTAAYALGGSLPQFADLMNQKAIKIGMTDSHFVTPSGLDDEEHYSTAHDMALLGAEAVKNPEFVAICSQKQIKAHYGNPPYDRTLTNHNKLLWKYDSTIGIKTGFTRKSGRCLVSAATQNGITLVAVTLHASDDWNDHIAMLDYGFSQLEKQSVTVSLGQLTLVGGKKSSVSLVLCNEPVLLNSNTVSTAVLLPPFAYAPVSAGDIVGTVRYYQEGKAVGESCIAVMQDVPVYVPKTNKTQNKKKISEKVKEFLLNFFTKR